LTVSKYVFEEDRDLTGCSVELDSNIFNLKNLRYFPYLFYFISIVQEITK